MDEEIVTQNEDIPTDTQEIISEAQSDTDAPASDETASPLAESEDTPETDYAEIVRTDMESLRRSFPELGENFSLSDLKDPLRFAALRDLGLTAKEAYLASGGRKKAYDNRAHLTASVPRSAVSQSADIPLTELKIARDLFSVMSDSELQRLYRRVNK